ncbi:tyrosine-type recombinase/integrase [Rosettibacter firmus]|uniref:tyrosine-type recombinase/integrase n=1 Tax=Rosettibacter firmus TaxID=3111522 RepID=UPI00336C22CA
MHKRIELINKYSKLLHLKNYSVKTEKSHLHHLNLFLDFISFNKIENINQSVLFNYFNYLKQSKNFSYSFMKQAPASFRFLFLDVLKKEIDFNFFIKIKKHRNLPNILTTEEVKNIINSIVNLKHRAIISTIYSCGLRILEVANLKIEHTEFLFFLFHNLCCYLAGINKHNFPLVSVKVCETIVIQPAVVCFFSVSCCTFFKCKFYYSVHFFTAVNLNCC